MEGSSSGAMASVSWRGLQEATMRVSMLTAGEGIRSPNELDTERAGELNNLHLNRRRLAPGLVAAVVVTRCAAVGGVIELGLVGLLLLGPNAVSLSIQSLGESEKRQQEGRTSMIDLGSGCLPRMRFQ